MKPLLKMDEACRLLNMSRKKLIDWLDEHSVDCAGKSFYVPNGNRRLFSEADIERILAVKREEEARRLREEKQKCPGNLSRRVRARRHFGTSEANTSESAWTKVQKLLTEPRRPGRSRAGAKKQNVVTFPSAQTQSGGAS